MPAEVTAHMDDGMDYDVQTKVRFRLDFNGSGEFNTLLLPDVQKQFVQHVKEVYQRDDTLGNGYISSDLNFQSWLSLLNSLMKIKHGKRQSIKQGITKITAAKTKAKLRKIAGKIFFRKAMIRAENKRLCIADHNVQPVQRLPFRIIFDRLMCIIDQRWAIAAIIITSYRAALYNVLLGKVSNGSLSDILCRFHFQIQGVSVRIQR